jgi:hypothetical protein
MKNMIFRRDHVADKWLAMYKEDQSVLLLIILVIGTVNRINDNKNGELQEYHRKLHPTQILL